MEDAVVKAAVEAVDKCVNKVVSAILRNGGEVLITADHGNAEKLVDTDGSPFTAHTTNPVPFILVNYDKDYTLKLRDAWGDRVGGNTAREFVVKPGKILFLKK